MFGFSNISMAIVASIAGTVVVGYCIYNKKRRSDPKYKKNLDDRRSSRDERKYGAEKFDEFFQRFMLEQEELQEAVDCMGRGDYELATDHLANTILLSGDPIEILYVMHQALPRPVFEMFISKVNLALNRSMENEVADPDAVPSTTEQSPEID